jgi:hypothetical protein
MEVIIAVTVIALIVGTLASGISLLLSKKTGQVKLKITLAILYALLIADYGYEGILVNKVENIGTGSGGDVGIFGHWWWMVVGVLVLSIIALQIIMFVRIRTVGMRGVD